MEFGVYRALFVGFRVYGLESKGLGFIGFRVRVFRVQGLSKVPCTPWADTTAFSCAY